jgi:hypothetical protein
MTNPPHPPSAELSAAIGQLVAAGHQGGASADEVLAEAAAFAAVLLPDDPVAAAAWTAAFGSMSRAAGPHALADARSRGARWRHEPTGVLANLVAAGSPGAVAYARALATLASAACSVGGLSITALERASVASSVQLRAAGVTVPVPMVPGLPGAVTPSVPGPAGSAAPPSVVPVAGGAATAAGAEPPAAPPPVPAPRPLEELYAELDALIGLDTVKAEIRRQAEVLRVATLREAKGLKVPDLTRHLVFTGNPGTGKTTIARLTAEIYASLGVLDKGQLVECDRGSLVAGYVGQTAIKTKEQIDAAMGGVLFIDEAYALARGGPQDFGREAIDTLVKALEDHRDDFVVIVAGYTGPMRELIDTNPGLESRFRLTIEFPDYTDDELVAIFQRLCAKAEYEPAPDALDALRSLLSVQVRDEGFGNARFVRNVFESALVRQAWRLRDVADPTEEQLRGLNASDVVEIVPPADASPVDVTRDDG